MIKISFSQRYLYKFFYSCLLIFSVTFVFCIAVTKPGIQHYHKSNVVNMVNGTAFRPFVYRTLVPYIANKINASIPQKTRQIIAQTTENNSTLKLIFSDRKWKVGYASEYYIVLILMYISLWGFAFSLTYLFKGVFKTHERFRDTVCLLTILGLPCLYTYNTYIYDFTTLFLFTLGLATVIRQKWTTYLWIFVLACINKETTILLTCIYAIHFFRHPKLDLSTYLFILGIQIVNFTSIKIVIDWLFLHNPGSIAEFWLERNAKLLLHPYSIANYLQWFVLGFLVIYKWSEKPLFLKQGLLILIPLLGTTLFWGWINELRDYYEAYPIVILLIAYSMARILGVSIQTATLPSTDDPFKEPTDTCAKVPNSDKSSGFSLDESNPQRSILDARPGEDAYPGSPTASDPRMISSSETPRSLHKELK